MSRCRATSRRKPASDQRGATLTEVLVCVVVTGIIFTMIATVSQPMFAASSAEEAKVDTIRSLGQAKFRLQRDVRQSDVNGVFVCTLANDAYTCTPASNYSTLTIAPYLAVLSLHTSGTGLINWDTTGRPAWTGFEVYWITTGSTGASTLMHSFSPATIPPGTAPTILNSDVADAVAAAVRSKSAEVIALGVTSIQTSVDVSKDRVALRLTAQATEERSTNETSMEADVFARN